MFHEKLIATSCAPHTNHCGNTSADLFVFTVMKTAIHPTQEPAVVTCATCGNEIPTRWSAGDVTVDTCSQCHPVYTGRTIRTTGGSRIERFEQRLVSKLSRLTRDAH
jgi:large subunit ribosomal protein L31